MFKYNLKTLMSLKSSPWVRSPLIFSNTLKTSFINALKSVSKRPFAFGNRTFKFSKGGNNFGSKFDKTIEDLVGRLPNRNIGVLLVGLNTFMYALYLIWPRDIMHKFLNNFTISNYNLSRGRFHTLITSHFAHMGFLSYAIDSVILYMFCQNLMFFHSPSYIVKLIMLSMAIGSALMMLQHSSSAMQRPW